MCANNINKYLIRHCEDLTGEHRLGDAGQLILFILFMVVWITDAFIFKYSTLLNDYIPFYGVRLWLGILILALAVYMVWTGMKLVFGTVRETVGGIWPDTPGRPGEEGGAHPDFVDTWISDPFGAWG